MSALKNAGFRNICLFFLDKVDESVKKMAYDELFSPLGLKPSNKCAPIMLLTAKSKTASAAAYDLMKNQKFSKDIDRVLKDVAGLQTSGKTDGGSNEGNGGIGDGLAGLFCGDSCSNKGGIATKAKGNVKTPTARDIDISDDGFRSESDIMKVVRQRTPGLRHLYNKFLKKREGFAGRIVLKLRIAPGGEVTFISIVSSTTGYGEFDASIKNAVSNWMFNKVDFGSTTVKIPFTFSEN
jgi:TonB family protein